MKKWIVLIVLTVMLLVADVLWHDELALHDAFQFMVLFFAIQSIVLFRLDQLTKEELKVQMSLVKMVVRLLSGLVFILVVMQTYGDHFSLVIQFFLLYLAYMTFEIIMAWANLRRN